MASLIEAAARIPTLNYIQQITLISIQEDFVVAVPAGCSKYWYWDLENRTSYPISECVLCGITLRSATLLTSYACVPSPCAL